MLNVSKLVIEPQHTNTEMNEKRLHVLFSKSTINSYLLFKIAGVEPFFKINILICGAVIQYIIRYNAYRLQY